MNQSAAALLRARSELMDSIAEASSAMKNESKEALRAAESTMASDLQALREEHRKSFTSNVERQQLLVDELRVEITEAGQFLELRTESRRSWEEMAARVRAENQANVEDFKAQLRTLRLELGEARKASKVSAEELRSLLDESSASWRRSLVDASALTAKAQTAADEANAECARLHSLVEAAEYIMEMLHPVLEEMVAETIHKMPKERMPFMLDWPLENEDLLIKVNKLKGQVQEAAKMASEALDDEPPPGWERDQPNKARTSVSAEAYGEWNAKKAFVPPVIVKTEEQKDRLKACLTKSFLFSELDASLAS
eukprot:g22546.t1